MTLELRQEWRLLITDRKGKVMFSHESVILFTIDLMPTRSLLNLRHSLLWYGRYASYWNTFLFERMSTSDDLPFVRTAAGAHCCKKLPWYVNSLDILHWQIYMVKLWTHPLVQLSSFSYSFWPNNKLAPPPCFGVGASLGNPGYATVL